MTMSGVTRALLLSVQIALVGPGELGQLRFSGIVGPWGRDKSFVDRPRL